MQQRDNSTAIKKLRTKERADPFIRILKKNLNEIVTCVSYTSIFTNKPWNLELKQKNLNT